MVVSCTLAAVCLITSGMPRLSTTIWRFEPDLPRSVGFGPVASPPRGRVPCLHPGWPATNPFAQRLPVFPTAYGAADPRRLLLASLAIAASRSFRCHSPSRPGAFPRGCLSAGQTRSQPKLLDWKPVVCRLLVFQVLVEAEVLCSAKVHRSLIVSPYPNHTNSWGFVRRSKQHSFHLECDPPLAGSRTGSTQQIGRRITWQTKSPYVFILLQIEIHSLPGSFRQRAVNYLIFIIIANKSKGFPIPAGYFFRKMKMEQI
jgi:hypothetical protein